MADFKEFVASRKHVFLPGALGTELQRRGYQTKLPLWSAGANLDAPELVTQIHKDYLDVGADICTTNTFRTTKRTYAKLGRPELARESLLAAVNCARSAADTVKDRPVFVGGSFAPLEDCYRPDLVPDSAALVQEHHEQAQWLAEAGVDFMFPETINSVLEAKIMAQAAHETGLPFIISFVVDAEGRLLDGAPLAEALDVTNFASRVAVGLNCRPIDTLDSAFSVLSNIQSINSMIYANGVGQPDDDQGWVFLENDDSIAKYTKAVKNWAEQGAKIIGGCCGTTPAYIKALKEALS